MTKVFFGGSRKIGRLNKEVKKRAENIIGKNITVLIGDANGADKDMQKYLMKRNYKNVIVFCMGNRCRNNIGEWKTHNIINLLDHRKKVLVYYSPEKKFYTLNDFKDLSHLLAKCDDKLIEFYEKKLDLSSRVNSNDIQLNLI